MAADNSLFGWCAAQVKTMQQLMADASADINRHDLVRRGEEPSTHSAAATPSQHGGGAS
jgi:hypothetical protein